MGAGRVGWACLGLLALLAGCERQAPRGAEAAAHAAEQPKPVVAALTPQAAPAPSDQDFAAQAAASDAFEIAAGAVAQQRAQNPAVRTLAAMLVADHQESAAKLKKASAESGATLAVSDAPNGEQQSQLGQLRQVDPKSFDKAYVDGQAQAHQTALAQLQAYAQNGQNPALKAYAGEAAAVVARHLQTVRGLGEKLP